MEKETNKQKNLRKNISMCLNRIEMVEKTLELFGNPDTSTELELKEFWELTLDNLKYDLDYFMSEYNIPEQE